MVCRTGPTCQLTMSPSPSRRAGVAGEAEPELGADPLDRVVIRGDGKVADEAHRSHYDDLDGYARHIRDALPNASFIAFTGTPISFDDRNTADVFGSVIDTYDLTRAVG